MRSKVSKRMLAKTPKKTKIFVDLYSAFVVLINSLNRTKKVLNIKKVEKISGSLTNFKTNIIIYNKKNETK